MTDMDEILLSTKTWIFGLEQEYGINPSLFASLYIGSVPPYLTSIWWVIRNYRRELPLMLPILSTGFFFILPALYLFYAGKELPVWIYLVIGVMVVYGSVSTYLKIRRRVTRSDVVMSD